MINQLLEDRKSGKTIDLNQHIVIEIGRRLVEIHTIIDASAECRRILDAASIHPYRHLFQILFLYPDEYVFIWQYSS